MLNDKIKWAVPYQPALRLGTNDLDVLGEQLNYAPLGITLGDKVLDLGGHIGLFAIWALSQEAGSVVSYEPLRYNRMFYEANLHTLNALVHTELVIATMDFNFQLYTPTQDDGEILNYGMSSIIHRNNFRRVPPYVNKMDPCNLTFVIAGQEFDVMKIDIEFSEYYLDWEALKHSSIQRFVVEWHFDPMHPHERMCRTEKQIYAQGYEVYHETDRTNGDQCLVFYRKKD